MGGKEGGRGYLYQGIVAVLEALRRNDWDRIYIEFPTEGDKVDIALKSADTITDAIQVKSTVNSFSKGDISKWLKDIITDYPCQRYCLVLIGNCAVSAVDFMNAITKFQTGKLDATGKKQLEKFETQLLKDINVDFKVLPFDPDSLKSLVREALWKYLHIFAAAPNAFMFHLGQVSRPFGKCILYEYDFEQRGNCSYIPSIQFDGKGGLE